MEKERTSATSETLVYRTGGLRASSPARLLLLTNLSGRKSRAVSWCFLLPYIFGHARLKFEFVDGKAGLSRVRERRPAEVALVTILCHLHGDTQRLHCVQESRLCFCIKSQLEREAAAETRLQDVGVGPTRLLPPMTWSSGKKQLNKLTCVSSPATVPELVKKKE